MLLAGLWLAGAAGAQLAQFVQPLQPFQPLLVDGRTVIPVWPAVSLLINAAAEKHAEELAAQAQHFSTPQGAAGNLGRVAGAVWLRIPARACCCWRATWSSRSRCSACRAATSGPTRPIGRCRPHRLGVLLAVAAGSRFMRAALAVHEVSIVTHRLLLGVGLLAAGSVVLGPPSVLDYGVLQSLRVQSIHRNADGAT